MNKLTIVFTVFIITFLSACSERSGNIPAFANPNTPEYRALAFFDAIYNSNDLKTTLQFVTEKHARIIKSYGSTKGYARYVLNLRFDKGVDLKIDRSLSQIQTGVNDKTSVNILFSGKYNGDRVNDLRKVNFELVDGEWLIAKIAGDPYARR